jgi:hypothetical protein
VDFPLVQNGVDYLSSACEHLRAGNATPRKLKYAVLHLQATAEVLLKARLQQEHWSLVLKDPGTATRAKFEAGDFDSCTTSAAVARLKDIVGVAIDDKSAKSLAILSKWCNALQHYGLKAPPEPSRHAPPRSWTSSSPSSTTSFSPASTGGRGHRRGRSV